ncbi:MAG: hypothetical protein WA869_31940 [Alloacidobacterium sp.]
MAVQEAARYLFPSTAQHSSRILKRRIAVVIPPSRPSPIQAILSATVAQQRKAAHNSLKRFDAASWAHVRRKLYDIQAES